MCEKRLIANQLKNCFIKKAQGVMLHMTNLAKNFTQCSWNWINVIKLLSLYFKYATDIIGIRRMAGFIPRVFWRNCIIWQRRLDFDRKHQNKSHTWSWRLKDRGWATANNLEMWTPGFLLILLFHNFAAGQLIEHLHATNYFVLDGGNLSFRRTQDSGEWANRSCT